MSEGTAVRTGAESRAELTFRDQSLTRLGANTLFSFGPGAHEYDLSNGAVLLCVPKQAGTAHVNTAAVTAAVTGGIAMAEFHHKSWTKFIVIEGKGVLIIRNNGQKLTLLPGEIVTLPPGGKTFTKPQAIDLRKLTQKSLLIRFSKLPGWAQSLIETAVENQQTSHPGGLTDATGFDAIDQRSRCGKAAEAGC
jgi:mannose-6-phosphate isomerase-like protein (cupin superfamily)